MPRIALAAVCLWLVPLWVPAQAAIQVIPDNTSYNVGDEVRLEIVFPGPDAVRSIGNLLISVRYAGESQPVLDRVTLSPPAWPTGRQNSTGHHRLWKIPFDARTGRYEIDLSILDSRAEQVVQKITGAASFVVHRKLVKISRFELLKPVYTSGDAVGCGFTLMNLSDRPASGLRVEFSDRHWPWIAQPTDRERIEVHTLREGFSLPAGQSSPPPGYSRCGLAKSVKQPTIHQYALVVWDQERKNVYDIAFSPLVMIQPPGVDSPKPYPNQYVYPGLSGVNVSSYRQFYPPALNSGAIQFDRSHTMLPLGSEATVKFSVANPTDTSWRAVSIRAVLRSLGSAEFANQLIAERVDLSPRGAPLEKEARFVLPSDGGGIFRVVVEIRDPSGQILASNSLELAASALPKSILIFCAHEDDDGAHAGIIRAAVENQIPIRFVYFTSGEAGSCDRYFQHSCSPAEALQFGALRMEEARASLGHLGVPRANIYFLGLPDGGSGQIWSNHVEPSNPYLSVLLACDHAPYEGLARPNLPYARRAVVEMAKEFIKKLQPEVIYTGHPDERHVDHRTNNWFVVKALQELLREQAVSPQLRLLVDQVYGPGPQTHAAYHYQKHILHVSGEAAARAQEAQWFYQSQGGNRGLGRLRTFDQLPRTEVHWQILDWKDHEGWNEKD